MLDSVNLLQFKKTAKILLHWVQLLLLLARYYSNPPNATTQIFLMADVNLNPNHSHQHRQTQRTGPIKKPLSLNFKYHAKKKFCLSWQITSTILTSTVMAPSTAWVFLMTMVQSCTTASETLLDGHGRLP